MEILKERCILGKVIISLAQGQRLGLKKILCIMNLGVSSNIKRKISLVMEIQNCIISISKDQRTDQMITFMMMKKIFRRRLINLIKKNLIKIND